MTMVDSRELLKHRLIEQVEPWTRWYRRSWEGGTVLALEEYSEALRWVPDNVLAQSSVDRLGQQLKSLIGRDPGIGSAAAKTQLNELLKSSIAVDSQAHRRLDHLTQFIRSRYLLSWRDEVMKGSPFHVERASRAIAGATLDAGFDPEWTRREIQSLVKAGAGAGDLIEELAALAKSPPKTFPGLVLIYAAPERLGMEAWKVWRSQAETRDLLRSWNHTRAIPTFAGALHFEVEAKDPYVAARLASERLGRLQAQVRFSDLQGSLDYETRFRGKDLDRDLREFRRSVQLRSSTATERLQEGTILHERPSQLDDALQLAAPLTEGPDTIAVTAAWAAIESIFAGAPESSRSSGKAVAADRAATIVTAAWPRAELARLSYLTPADERANPLLAIELANEQTSQGRARTLGKWIAAGKPVSLSEPRNVQAHHRMTQLLGAPTETLRRVRAYTGAAFHRLYRQRNMVLHGGHLKPIALESTLACAGPLVAAVLDQAVHAKGLHGVSPLALAARAEVARGLLTDGPSWEVVDQLN